MNGLSLSLKVISFLNRFKSVKKKRFYHAVFKELQQQKEDHFLKIINKCCLKACCMVLNKAFAFLLMPLFFVFY